MQWHVQVEKTPKGTYKASTASAPRFASEAQEPHQAVNALKEQLRNAAVRGEL